VGNDDGLDALGKELQSMIVTDSLLNENSQETGTIVEVLERGELEITRTMQNERMESVKRFILGLICRSLICS
jgi:ribosome maturation protein Sdo1